MVAQSRAGSESKTAILLRFTILETPKLSLLGTGSSLLGVAGSSAGAKAHPARTDQLAPSARWTPISDGLGRGASGGYWPDPLDPTPAHAYIPVMKIDRGIAVSGNEQKLIAVSERGPRRQLEFAVLVGW